MSRPKPSILLSWTNPKTYKSEQVLAADAVYAVYYDGKPINLRSLNSLLNYPGPKYPKTVFVHKGSAFNLAEKLNKMFKTDKFKVMQMVASVEITENDEPTTTNEE
jgi:hypothetical protein